MTLSSHVYQITEFGKIYQRDVGNDYINTLNELYLPVSQFNALIDYICLSQANDQELSNYFAILVKGKKKIIRVKNYVGIIQVANVLTIEVLPKISMYSDDCVSTKKIFLRMLSRLDSAPFKAISQSDIEAIRDYPIAEVFIDSYIKEVEILVSRGLRSGYISVESNNKFPKGKLLVSKNVKYNTTRVDRVYCSYDEYSQNIMINGIIKTTLKLLLSITKNYSNYRSLCNLLTHFEMIDEPVDIKSALNSLSFKHKIFSGYSKVIEWSKVFLNGMSFSPFSGSVKNLSIMYPMEVIFESYLSSLFKEQLVDCKVSLQDASCYLIDNHDGQKVFRLKPDIVVESKNLKIIIDAKWKLINQYARHRNYNVSQADMYQLYAYGKKYYQPDVELKLILIYPSSDMFHMPLSRFMYDAGLRLDIIPFDFSVPESVAVKNIMTEYLSCDP